LAALDDWSESVTSVAGPFEAVVLLNKVDLPDVQVSLPEAEAFATKRGWSCLPTSAKTGENVEAAFRLIAQRYLASLAKA
jgi:50S ribosomal subunit-associated GTPase HflX